ncbi:hypothetical protein K474DRAFT_1660750 [Panus rudis PR-1116 ss-1]|nr:hypothetical protein K474DRAFT_1660750 [Panus rudis PR-1116 ss-1]
MPRDATLSAQEIEIACQLLTDFLPTIVDPKTVDKIIGPAILVKPFFDIWVSQMAARGLHLKIVDHFREEFQDSRTTYATRETLPPPSPAFASYNVFKASEDDIIALAHLYVEFTKGAPMPATFEQGLNAMGDGVKIGRVWCCKVDGKIAGYILVGRTTPRTIAIRNVYTSPDYRRRGIAEAMVRAVTRYYLGAEPLGFEGAPDKGPVGGIKEEVNLNVADPGARRLYKRCGFLLDDDARDPKTGKIGWYASLWRGVQPVGEE